MQPRGDKTVLTLFFSFFSPKADTKSSKPSERAVGSTETFNENSGAIIKKTHADTTTYNSDNKNKNKSNNNDNTNNNTNNKLQVPETETKTYNRRDDSETGGKTLQH